MDEKQETFLMALESFMDDVKAMKQFKGKAKVIRSLERVSKLAVFRED